MIETLNYSGQLTVVTCWCGMRHAVPEELRDFQRRQFDDGVAPTGIYCPLGHSHIPAGERKVHKLEREIEQQRQRTIREQQSHDQTRAELRETERRRRAEKGAKTRIKNRVANGVCPCCNRSFTDLAAHMKTKHPKYTAES